MENILAAIASTNAIISAACALETLKITSGCSKTLSNYLPYNGAEGLHTKVTEFVKDKDCLVCGPGVLVELETLVTLEKFISLLEEHPKRSCRRRASCIKARICTCRHLRYLRR